MLINYKTTQTEKIKGLMKKAPFTAILFLFGILSIIALPPSILFVSEYTMFTSAFALHPFLSLLIFAALSVIAYAMLRSTIGMFFSEGEDITSLGNREKWNLTHWVMIVQLILVVGLTFFFSSADGLKFIDLIAKDIIYIAQ
ncbi:MAG TPA: hypothetical protein DDY21_03840 [Candidatus Moranbacteria bacterium]|nr:hypothetical protein [Candidatus Moranbacteria bacterium]